MLDYYFFTYGALSHEFLDTRQKKAPILEWQQSTEKNSFAIFEYILEVKKILQL